jgi:hypothetical protein
MMTGSVNGSVERLALWSLDAWSLTDTLVLEFINVRGATERGPNHATLVFVAPARVSMKALKRQGGDIGVKSAHLVGNNGEGIAFEMDALAGGRVEVEAREFIIFFH